MKLLIGNKNYSSWSMRPWMAARTAGIPFEEEVVWLWQPDTAERIRAVCPTGKVPALIDDGMVVFESIAILEYLAERAPALWPEDRRARAHARSICAEMHGGFVALRSRCPMNVRRAPKVIELGREVEANVDRIVEIWSGCRARFGAGGTFLFGRFTNADAMFAPVVSRLHAYDIPVPASARAYMEAVMATDAWVEWQRDALAETRSNSDIDTVT